LKLENTEKKLLARPQHRQNNHQEVRYDGENLILAHDRVQWQALMNTEMILPVLERWKSPEEITTKNYPSHLYATTCITLSNISGIVDI
jgi:hypothetical protein